MILKRCIFLSLMLCFLGSANAFSQSDVMRLNLHRLYAINGPDNFQPSGLTIIDNRLYTVSDKHDQFIYCLDLSEKTAKAVPAVKMPHRISTLLHSSDFEGITHDGSGNFYLASESYNRVLKISPDGKTADWITPDLKPYVNSIGLLQKKNAGFEGICYISPTHYILCAEREPRGFVEINPCKTPVDVNAYASEKSRFEFPENVRKDFSGLYYYHNAVYVLERNAFVVCRLNRKNNRLAEGAAWSYDHVEKTDACRYTDMAFGKAEGLCIDNDYIYIIIDNNGLSRAGDPDDHRPFLMILDHPDNL